MFALTLRIQKASSRRLQEVLVKANIFVLAIHHQYVFKTSSRRLAKTSFLHKRLQDILKATSRRLQDNFKMSSKRLQEIFKTSSRRFECVFKMSSRHLYDVLQRYLQDVFKKYHQVKLFLLTPLPEVFNTFLRRSFPKTFICRGICLGNTTS